MPPGPALGCFYFSSNPLGAVVRSLDTDGDVSLRPLNSWDLVLFLWNNKLERLESKASGRGLSPKNAGKPEQTNRCKFREMGNGGGKTSSPRTQPPPNPYGERLQEVLTENAHSCVASSSSRWVGIWSPLRGQLWCPSVASCGSAAARSFPCGCRAGRGPAGTAGQSSTKMGFLLSPAPSCSRIQSSGPKD